MRKILIALCLVTFSVSFASADDKKPAPKKEEPKKDDKPAPKEKSLYDRLGGKKAVTAVVHDFVKNVVADKRINKMFAKTKAPKLEALLVDQICEAAGGGCKYKGKTMADAHKGMKITDADFTALVEDLVKSLDKFKVPEKEKGELLGALGGMKGDIVGK